MAERAQFDVAEIRRSLRISEVVGREVTWDRHKSVPAKGDYWACCPFHGEKTPSFHVDDRKGLFHCFGCKASGDIFSFVQKISNVSFAEAVRELAGLAGIGPQTAPATPADAERKARLERERQEKQQRADDQAKRDQANRIKFAREMWQNARPASETLVSVYLACRGITRDIPASLRFEPECVHRPTGEILPAMIGCMQGPQGEFAGVHRTYLKPDGTAKADVEPVKMMLGNAVQAAVRFSSGAERMYITEGIETALSVIQVQPGAHVWAALSMGNMGRLVLPFECKTVVLVADNDTKDWRVGRKLMKQASQAYAAQGRQVATVWPNRGMDLNDVLMKGQKDQWALRAMMQSREAREQ